jgi:hypothetical protein
LATSGTYSFLPSLGSLTLSAFQRLQIRPTAITQTHLDSAMQESNLMQASWSADGINWWTVEMLSVPLVQGTQTYAVSANVVSVLDVIINNGSSNRLILPFSRTDFASLGNPQSTGFPTSFWWDRALSPTINLWPVPDGSATYTMDYYAYTQTQDATFGNGSQPAIPYWWLDAYVAGLAYRLSRIWAPALEQLRAADAKEAYATASKQVENAPLYVTPGLADYFR